MNVKMIFPARVRRWLPFFLLWGLLAPAAPGNDLDVEGSAVWIARFIDRSGGCVTLLNTQPTFADNIVRGMVCPGCDTAGKLRWLAENPDTLNCSACGALVSDRTFPATGHLEFDGMSFEYFTNGKGKDFFIKPEIRYLKSLYAMHRARSMARLAKRNRDPKLARQALDIMLAYGDYYRQYICNVSGRTVYRPGWPRQCNWGRITHFGDYVFPNWFCQIYRDIADSGLTIEAADRAGYRALLEEIISEINLPFIRQVGGMGNPMGAAFADCIWAGRVFPEGRFRDYYTPDDRGNPRILSGIELIHETVEGRHGLNNLLANFWYSDGLMRERSVAYQQMLTRGLQATATSIKGYSDPENDVVPAAGYKAFKEFDLLREPVLKRIFDEHNRISFPDGRSIPIGDDYGDLVCKNPLRNSSFHHGWGVGALRLGKEARTACAVLNWGSGHDGHSHNDMLSLLYYGENMLMLSPTEYPAHRDGIIREEWWRGGAAAHNTVVIDGVNHERSRGDAVLFSESPQLAAVRAFSGQAYAKQGWTLQRTALLIDTRPNRTPYLLDVFEVKGGRSHDYFLQAQAPKYGPAEVLSVIAPVLKPSGEPNLAVLLKSGDQAGYGYIARPELAPLATNGELRWTFPVPGNETVLRAILVPDGEEVLYCGEAPGVRNVKEKDQSRLVKKIVRRRTGAENLKSEFISVFESYHAAGRPDLTGAKRLELSGPGIAIRMEHGYGVDLVLLSTGAGKLSLTFGNKAIEFDGSAALLAWSSETNTARLTAVGGTRFRYGEQEIECGGTIRGRLLTGPEGLNPNFYAEKNAAVMVDAAMPKEAVGGILFIRQSNGGVSGWKIAAATGLPGGSRLAFDRSARNAMLEIDRLSRDSKTVENACTSFVRVGDRVQFGDEWRQVVRVIPPEPVSPFSGKPSINRYELAKGNLQLELDRPVDPETARKGTKAPVSEIGAGDEFFMPVTVFREIPAGPAVRR